MGWSCDRSTRDLASAAAEFYGSGTQPDRAHRLKTRDAQAGRRPWWVNAGVWASILVPFVLVFSAASNHPSHLVLLLKPLWPLLGLSVVLIVVASRRRRVL